MQTIQSVLVAHTWPRAFSTLHSAIKAVGLEYVLEGYKPVTLFAPSDEAFNQLHQGAIYDLVKDIDLLRALLEYHIVPLKLTRATLMQVASSPLPEGGSTPQNSPPGTDDRASDSFRSHPASQPFQRFPCAEGPGYWNRNWRPITEWFTL